MPPGNDVYLNAGRQKQLIYVDDKGCNVFGRYYAKEYVSAFSDIGIDKYGSLLRDLPWEAVKANHGRGVVTRSSCWFTNEPCECKYKYGNKFWKSNPTPAWIMDIGKALCDLLEVKHDAINSCNANKYTCDTEDLYWHSDGESLFRANDAFDRDVFIVSVSFGATRAFHVRKKFHHNSVKLWLHDGDVATMEKCFQDKYEHTVPKGSFIGDDYPIGQGPSSSSSSSGAQSLRYNLTFRLIKRHCKECPLNS